MLIDLMFGTPEQTSVPVSSYVVNLHPSLTFAYRQVRVTMVTKLEQQMELYDCRAYCDLCGIGNFVILQLSLEGD